ncbi:MAG: hypothetical protein RR128_09470 [Clostridium sp.]
MLVFNHTGHVAMWNYVVNTLSSITEETFRTDEGIDTILKTNIISLKKEFILKNYTHSIKCACFACDYAHKVKYAKALKVINNTTRCNYCPLKGIDTDYDCMNGLDRFSAELFETTISNIYIIHKSSKIDVSHINNFLSSLQEVISTVKLIRDFPVKNNIKTI